jgi:hypothetical protein
MPETIDLRTITLPAVGLRVLTPEAGSGAVTLTVLPAAAQGCWKPRITGAA